MKTIETAKKLCQKRSDFQKKKIRFFKFFIENYLIYWQWYDLSKTIRFIDNDTIYGKRSDLLITIQFSIENDLIYWQRSELSKTIRFYIETIRLISHRSVKNSAYAGKLWSKECLNWNEDNLSSLVVSTVIYALEVQRCMTQLFMLHYFETYDLFDLGPKEANFFAVQVHLPQCDVLSHVWCKKYKAKQQLPCC